MPLSSCICRPDSCAPSNFHHRSCAFARTACAIGVVRACRDAQAPWLWAPLSSLLLALQRPTGVPLLAALVPHAPCTRHACRLAAGARRSIWALAKAPSPAAAAARPSRAWVCTQPPTPPPPSSGRLRQWPSAPPRPPNGALRRPRSNHGRSLRGPAPGRPPAGACSGLPLHGLSYSCSATLAAQP